MAKDEVTRNSDHEPETWDWLLTEKEHGLAIRKLSIKEPCEYDLAWNDVLDSTTPVSVTLLEICFDF